MKAVVLNPHDDDAIISIGGTLIKLIQNGWKIKYVQMTDGRHGSNLMTPEETKKIRAEESEKERAFIGIDDFFAFDIEDGALAKLSKKELNVVIQKTANLIKEYKSDIVFIPCEFENHPDHYATNKIGKEAIKLLEKKPVTARYIVWFIPFLEHKVKPFQKLLLVDINNQIEKKLEGVRMHASQEKEGHYSKIAEAINKYNALIYTTYSHKLETAEIIAITNLNDNSITKDFGKFIDVTNVYHGRKIKKIKAE